METKTKMFVNLEKNQITRQIIIKKTIFNPRFVIESDIGGFSYLEKQEDEIHYINYSSYKKANISDRIITEEEAKELIKAVENRELY